jgi:hypothetical protein
MTAKPNFASDALAELGTGDVTAPVASTGPFVLNLCSSTTPMALAQADLPELKRFTFFVSRRFEEGRERFRLHMGYFATLAEAEEWLSVVREIYPGAWAGEAPGRKLRERAAAAQAAQAQHAAGPQQQVSTPRAAPAPVAVTPPPPPPAPFPPPQPLPMESLALRAPVLKAAPAVRAPAPSAARPAAKPAAAKPTAPAARPMAASQNPVRRPLAAPPTNPAVAPARAAAPRAPAPAISSAARTASPAPRTVAAEKSEKSAKGVFGDSNVREVLQALGDASATGETRLMRAPPPPPPPKEAPPAKNNLSDTQVLKMLETRRPEGSEPPPAADPAHGAIPLLKPDDTGTREALKEAVTQNAPVLFAVQLQWSVQAVELDKVPPLAIFSAYTLYTVEGSRDARKWYGLRLGFFSDAISAKQVAHYVRSEFTSVAVVPVSPQEKARATEQDKQAATLGGPVATPAPVDEFKLIDDDGARAQVAKLSARPGTPAATPSGADAAGRKVPGRPIPRVAVGRAMTQTVAAPPAAARAPVAPTERGREAGKVGAREKRGPQSLEETLEILGASQLSIDNGNGETLNESGVRHLRVEVQKNSPFSKLLERLSERMKKS